MIGIRKITLFNQTDTSPSKWTLAYYRFSRWSQTSQLLCWRSK